MKYSTIQIISILLLSTIFISCEKDSLEKTNPFDLNNPSAGSGFPQIADGSMEGIYANGAIFKGKIFTQGASDIYDKGVCYNYSGNPSLSFMKISAGSGMGSYECNFTSLLPGYTYYLRAYATNINGTTYGNQLSFTTTQ
jgi:hypothetical protein